MLKTELSIRESVAHRIGASRFRTWFGEGAEFVIHPLGLDVIVASDFACKWIATNYMEDLVAAAEEVLGADPQREVRVIFRTQAATDPLPKLAPPAPPAPRPRRRGPELRGDLETFVVGPCNRLAYAAATAVTREPGVTFRQLVIHGGCGLGKSHLLQGVCNAIRRDHPTLEWRYVSGEEFTNEYIRALQEGRIERFRARFRDVGILVIDDIHFLANKKATQEEFLHTFDAIDACGKGVILSSDRHPRAIATLSEALINRLIAGVVVCVEPPDRETRLEILRRRAAAGGITVPAEGLEYVAERVTRNVRELEGALLKMKAIASIAGTPLDLTTVKRAVDDLVDHRVAPTISEIVRRVAVFFGVTREQILSTSRDRTVSLARGFAMFLARTQTAMSYPEIGRAMGSKNHSTVLMAHQRIERCLSADERLAWKAAGAKREASARQVLEKLLSEPRAD
jgi:chromosomal replication initiator protein